MCTRDRAGDGEPETGAAGITATGGIESHERREDSLVVLKRDAGPLVIDFDVHRAGRIQQPDAGTTART